MAAPVEGPQGHDLIQEFLTEAADPRFVASLTHDLLVELYTKIMEMPEMSVADRVDTLNQLRRYKRQLAREGAGRAGGEARAPSENALSGRYPPQSGAPTSDAGPRHRTRRREPEPDPLLSAHSLRYRLLDSIRLRVL